MASQFRSTARSGRVRSAVGFSVRHMKELQDRNKFGKYRVVPMTTRNFKRLARKGR